MSWLDDVVDVGKSVFNFVTDNGIGSAIARTALLGVAVNQFSKNVTPANRVSQAAQTTAVDRGVRLQVDPDTEHKIPVVYGTAYLGGIITDVQLANNNKTLYACMTICEKTGTIMSSSTPSAFTFQNIFWNDNRIVFKSDGITAAYMTDRDGNIDYTIADNVKIYCFAGSSSDYVVPKYYTNNSLAAAYTIMPGWDSNYSMSDLIFAIVRIDYNKEKNLTGLPTLNFQITNTLTQPGDCLYDYMTNTRYGAGIDPTEIYSQ